MRAQCNCRSHQKTFKQTHSTEFRNTSYWNKIKKHYVKNRARQYEHVAMSQNVDILTCFLRVFRLCKPMVKFIFCTLWKWLYKLLYKQTSFFYNGRFLDHSFAFAFDYNFWQNEKKKQCKLLYFYFFRQFLHALHKGG